MENVRIDTLPDDLFLVSYPKSGNTWLRYLFGHYLSGEETPNISEIIPDIYKNPAELAALKAPRYIKSHEPYRPEYPRVIYIVRDGRDVAVSYYFHMQSRKRIPDGMSFRDYVKAFNADQLDPFSTWSDHVHSWLDNAPEKFLLLRYEDMKADTQTQFLRCLEFAGLPIDMERVNFTIEACDFQNLKKREEAWYKQQGKTPLHPFFRKGTSGQWQDRFTDEMLETFLARHGSALERMGYIEAAPALEKTYEPMRRNLEKAIGQQDGKYLALKQELAQELAQVRQQLDQAHKTIAEMEASKFWSMRQAWVQLKHRLSSTAE
ncbi:MULTISPECIES: sulfotransferase domain-containing protein [unclassified Leptolyngbya]|uniref:sulfotransferase domain-containing protein n=1 Tax=unclassified Leptolyngbya TaxID=2650499 RepID=UPI00168859A2|nr:MULTISPECIES: sulfotransferase domain-containing protein [unclassified Leptolyngbya]MBD1910618.1 sulfotransferase domain-containing protein [Leptolyngbya sp. FACHB-8]MBD2154558.1 sulfotransferase domain-containing protein [Leptolyngbya sp. FACHB-16]